jgi:hypothetical protein
MGVFGWSYPPGAASDPFAPYNEQEQPNIESIKEAWPDAEGLFDVYRQTYKATGCGPTIGFLVNYIEVIPPDGFSDFGGEIERANWFYNDDLKQFGTWKVMEEQGIYVSGVSVSSIVEGSEAEVPAIEIDIDPYTQDPEELTKAFDAAVKSVDEQADELWNEANRGEDDDE